MEVVCIYNTKLYIKRLHSLPGGTKLCFGVFSGQRLLGTLTLGAIVKEAGKFSIFSLE